MNNQIENIRLKFNCTADWSGMEQTAGGRHCNSCSKTVYDFTDAEPFEFLGLLNKNGNNICGRFKPEQMAAQPKRVPLWQKWVSAALVLIGINIFNTKLKAQAGKPIAIKQQSAVTPDTYVLGDVEVNHFDKMPEFPGGDKAMFSFIRKHLIYKKEMKSGKIYAAFNISKDGSVSDVRILRGLGKLNDDAVIRILKMFPKWKPAVSKGKATSYVGYIIPIQFDVK